MVILNIIRQIFLFPVEADKYSRFYNQVDSYHVSKIENATSRYPIITNLQLFIIYFVLVLPFLLSNLLVYTGWENIAIVVIIILATSMLLGSLHPTFGAVIALSLSLFSIFNNGIRSYNGGQVSSVLIASLFFLLLPVAFYTQVLSQSDQPHMNRVYRLLLVVGICSVEILTLHLAPILQVNKTPSNIALHYAFIILAGGIALTTPIKKAEKDIKPGSSDKVDNDWVNWIGDVIVFVILSILVWYQCNVWFHSLAPTLRIILEVLLTAISWILMAVISIIISLIWSEKSENNIFWGERSWLFLLSFAAFNAYNPNQALLGSAITVLIYSLSIFTLNRLQQKESWLQFGIVSAIGGLISFCFSAMLINLSSFVYMLRIVFPNFNTDPSFSLNGQAFWLSIAAIIIFSLFTIQRSTVSGAIFAFILVAIGNIIFSQTAWGTLQYLPISLVIGLVIGFPRIILWPLISGMSLVISRKIRSARLLSETEKAFALMLATIYCFPIPFWRLELIGELLNRGLIENEINTDYGKNLLRRARAILTKNLLENVTSLQDLFSIDLTGTLPFLSKEVAELASLQNTSIKSFEKVRRLSISAYNIQQKQQEKLNSYSNQFVLNKKEIALCDHCGQLIYKEAMRELEQYWLFYRRLEKHATIYNTIEQLSLSDFNDTDRSKISAAFQKRMQQTMLWIKELHEFDDVLDNISPEELSVYTEIISIDSALPSLTSLTLNLPEQSRLVQSWIETLERIKLALDKEWRVFQFDKQEVVIQPNPWLSEISSLTNLLLELSNLIQLQFEWGRKNLILILQQINEVDQLGSISKKLDALNGLGEVYGPLLDEALLRLDLISKEAASALAFPKGYNRRLGLQDTLDRVNELRHLLATRFLVEADEITQPLGKIAMMLTDTLYSGAEEKTVGYRNPYLTGNPIKLNRASLFKGRRDLIQNITAATRSRSAATFILFGPRRMGKTSFLLQLPRLLPAQYLPVYLDMQEGGSQSDSNFFYSLATAIYRQVKTLANIRANKPDWDNFKSDPFVSINNWIDDILPQINNRTIFFTIDEFEAIGKAISEGKLKNKQPDTDVLDESVLGYLRHLMQHNDNLVLLFAGVHSISGLGPNASSYFISAYPIEMSYLTPNEARELITNPDPSAGAMPTYDEELILEILRLTHCQPYLIQTICSELIIIANEKNTSCLELAHLELAVKKVLSTSLYFQNIWEDSGRDGKNVLIDIINGRYRDSEENQKFTAELLQRHVIERINDEYKIEIPLVEEWLWRQIEN